MLHFTDEQVSLHTRPSDFVCLPGELKVTQTVLDRFLGDVGRKHDFVTRELIMKQNSEFSRTVMEYEGVQRVSALEEALALHTWPQDSEHKALHC